MSIDALYRCLQVKGDDNTIKARNTLNDESLWLIMPSGQQCCCSFSLLLHRYPLHGNTLLLLYKIHVLKSLS